MDAYQCSHESNISGRERLCIASVKDSTLNVVGDAGGANTGENVNSVGGGGIKYDILTLKSGVLDN